jgi:hypothetical protein
MVQLRSASVMTQSRAPDGSSYAERMRVRGHRRVVRAAVLGVELAPVTGGVAGQQLHRE